MSQNSISCLLCYFLIMCTEYQRPYLMFSNVDCGNSLSSTKALLPHPTLQVITQHRDGLPVLQPLSTSYPFHARQCTLVSPSLPTRPPHPPNQCPHVHSLNVRVSIPARLILKTSKFLALLSVQKVERAYLPLAIKPEIALFFKSLLLQ